MAYRLLNRDDPAIENFRGAFFKMRRALGVTGFGINEVRLPPGEQGAEHDEASTGHDEVYVILAGSCVFRIDQDHVPAGVGDYLRVDAASTRQVTAGDAGVQFVVVGARPKPAYDGRRSL